MAPLMTWLFVASAVITAASQDDVDALAAAILPGDDECSNQATGDSDCTFTALQLRGTPVEVDGEDTTVATMDVDADNADAAPIKSAALTASPASVAMAKAAAIAAGAEAHAAEIGADAADEAAFAAEAQADAAEQSAEKADAAAEVAESEADAAHSSSVAAAVALGLDEKEEPEEAGSDYDGADDMESMMAMDEDMEAIEDMGEAGLEDGFDEAEDKNASSLELIAITPVDKVPVTGCHGENGTACPDGETCLVKYDKTWSQCFSCSKATFGKECQKLDDFMRYAAIRTCKQTCLDTKCYNKNWCHRPYRCIVDKEEQWGQCISCTSKKYWTSSCNALKDGLGHIASRVCHRRCGR